MTTKNDTKAGPESRDDRRRGDDAAAAFLTGESMGQPRQSSM
ncbi:MAG: hypothetical protein R6W88_09740 [Desulfobacterales bacterium]